MAEIGICFHFEDKDSDFWSGHRIDLDLWRIPAKAQGISKLACINLSSAQYSFNDSEIDLTQYGSLKEFEREHKGQRIIYLEATNALQGIPHRSLFDIELTDCWFVIGASYGLSPSRDDGKEWITIPQVNESVMKHGFQAGQTLMDYLGFRKCQSHLTA